MKAVSRIFVLVGFVLFVFCGQALSSPTIDGVVNDDEWGSGDYTTTSTSGGGVNPSAEERGNLHIEEGGSYDTNISYDAEKLGFIIEGEQLYISLQSNYDFTSSDAIQGTVAGDFIFQFTNVEDDTSTSENEITDASSLAISFSFDDTDNDGDLDLSSLTFYWGDIEFETTDSLQSGLAYSVDEDSVDEGESATYTAYDSETTTETENTGAGDGDNDGHGHHPPRCWNSTYSSTETTYTLELAISLASLDEAIQALFASSNYAQMHWQMSCGNDVLYVADDYTYPTPQNTGEVPEPSTFFLLGLGLLGAGFLERRRQEKQQKKS